MSKRIVSKRMVIMLIVLVIIFGAIFGWKAFMARMINNYFDHMPTPAASISTYDAQQDNWALTLEAVGTVNAVNGVEVTTQVQAGIRPLPEPVQERQHFQIRARQPAGAERPDPGAGSGAA